MSSNMSSHSLQEQTKEERQAVLYQLAQASLPAYGLTGASLTLLQDLVNCSFRLQHECGSWYLRIYNPVRSDRTLVTSELLWLEALANQEMPVPRPLRTIALRESVTRNHPRRVTDSRRAAYDYASSNSPDSSNTRSDQRLAVSATS